MHAVWAVAFELESVAYDVERRQLCDALQPASGAQALDVVDAAAGETPDVLMLVGAAIIACRSSPQRELAGDAAAHEGLERLVHGREADVRELLANRRVDVVGGRVARCIGQGFVDRSALRREAMAAGLERVTELLGRGISGRE